MSKFKKISASKFETSRFYQLPKFLFEDNYFSKMTTEAKVMYASKLSHVKIFIHKVFR